MWLQNNFRLSVALFSDKTFVHCLTDMYECIPAFILILWPRSLVILTVLSAISINCTDFLCKQFNRSVLITM